MHVAKTDERMDVALGLEHKCQLFLDLCFRIVCRTCAFGEHRARDFVAGIEAEQRCCKRDGFVLSPECKIAGQRGVQKRKVTRDERYERRGIFLRLDHVTGRQLFVETLNRAWKMAL